MIIAPIIFCTMVVGIAGMKDMKKVGRTGGLALLYFEVVSTFALIIGLVLVNFFKPGVATLVVATWTNELDMERLHAGLNNETWEEAQEPEQILGKKTEYMSVLR